MSLHGRGRRVFTNTFRILEVTSVAAVADRVRFKERRETAPRLLVPVLAVSRIADPVDLIIVI
jgi:hypothetical protein